MDIEKKLGDRILARKARNFDLADDIREELLRDYMVDVDDRAKEWMVMAPEGGVWADDDDVEDETNIVSKEEWYGDGSFADDDDEDEEVDDIDNDEVDAEDEVAVEPVQAKLDQGALSSMTVPQLKDMLKEKGLPVSGKKAELIDRLIDSA
jgi:hypothetical protein